MALAAGARSPFAADPSLSAADLSPFAADLSPSAVARSLFAGAPSRCAVARSRLGGVARVDVAEGLRWPYESMIGYGVVCVAADD
jgi:hypothetical protein